MGSFDETMRTGDTEVLKCLLNPVRYALFSHLQFLDAPAARVSDLAKVVDKPVNSVSYHLAELEAKGLAKKVKPLGQDSRETWYARGSDGLSFEMDSETARSAPTMALLNQILGLESPTISRYRQRALEQAADNPASVQFMTTKMFLTAEQESEFYGAMGDLFTKAHEQSLENRAQESREGINQTYFHVEYFPLLDDDDEADQDR